jgi:hypothetical protein
MTTLPEPEVNAVVKLVDRLTKERDEARAKAQVETDFSDQMRMERDAARAALREHRAATDDMARKHAEEGARWSMEMGEMSAELAESRAEAKHYMDVGQRELNARLALEADLAARPVVESVEARRLREAFGDVRFEIVDASKTKEIRPGVRSFCLSVKSAEAVNAFLASAPPSSPAVGDDVRRAAEKLIAYTDNGTLRWNPREDGFFMTDEYVEELIERRDALSAALAAAPKQGDDGSKIVRFKLGPDGTLTNIDELSFTTQREIRLDLHDVLESNPDALSSALAAAPKQDDARVTGEERQRLQSRIIELQASVAAERAAHASTRLGYERSEADLEAEVVSLGKELARIKLAPAVERAVDRELREEISAWVQGRAPEALSGSAMRLYLAAMRWLSAPRAPDGEYVEAAVALAEAYVTSTSYPVLMRCKDAFSKLYDARKRGEADHVADASKKVERSPLDIAARELAEARVKAFDGKRDGAEMRATGVWMDLALAHNRYLALRNAGGEVQAEHVNAPQVVDWPSKGRALTNDEVSAIIGGTPAAPPAQETVTLYTLEYNDGQCTGGLLSQTQMEAYSLRAGEHWLAIDARRVEKGGAS